MDSKNGNKTDPNKTVDKLTLNGKKRNLKPNFIDNLLKSMGNVSIACKNTTISREIYYKWLKEDLEFKKQCEEVMPEKVLDFVESKLFSLIDGVKCVKYYKNGEEVVYERPPDNTSIIFYLKTKGKKRGYIEKTQIEHSGGIENKTDLDNLPIEKKKKILDIMRSDESKEIK